MSCTGSPAGRVVKILARRAIGPTADFDSQFSERFHALKRSAAAAEAPPPSAQAVAEWAAQQRTVLDWRGAAGEMSPSLVRRVQAYLDEVELNPEYDGPTWTAVVAMPTSGGGRRWPSPDDPRPAVVESTFTASPTGPPPANGGQPRSPRGQAGRFGGLPVGRCGWQGCSHLKADGEGCGQRRCLGNAQVRGARAHLEAMTTGPVPVGGPQNAIITTFGDGYPSPWPPVAQPAHYAGRQDDVAFVHQTIRRLQGGQGSTVLFAGDEGVGRRSIVNLAVRAAIPQRGTTMPGLPLPGDPVQVSVLPIFGDDDRPLENTAQLAEDAERGLFSRLTKASAGWKGVSAAAEFSEPGEYNLTTRLRRLAARRPVLVAVHNLDRLPAGERNLLTIAVRNAQSSGAPVTMVASVSSDVVVVEANVRHLLPFTPEETEDALRTPSSGYGLDWDADAVGEMHSASGGHPGDLAVLATSVFDSQSRSPVTIDDVRVAVARADRTFLASRFARIHQRHPAARDALARLANDEPAAAGDEGHFRKLPSGLVRPDDEGGWMFVRPSYRRWLRSQAGV